VASCRPVLPARRAAALALLAALVALALRLAQAGAVYQGPVVGLGPDGDPLYHALQAERLLAGAPGAPWFDPGLDWPNGAWVPWPPLFDAGLALATWSIHGAEATGEQVAAVAAAAPPLLGALSVVLAGALCAALFGRGGAVAAFLLAGLGAHLELTRVGRADQHALELVLAPALWLAFARALAADPRRRRLATAALALLVAASFWAWMGSAFLLAVPVLGALLLHLVAAEEAGAAARALALGCGGGAALLAGSLALLGPAGALGRTSAVGLTGLHVAIAVGCALIGALLLLARRLRPAPPAPVGRRALEAAAAVLLPMALLLLGSPGLRGGAGSGLLALRAEGAWYADITEFLPLVGTGREPLAAEAARALVLLGLVPALAAAGAVVLLRRRPPAQPPAAPTALALVGLCWAAVLLALALARYRFLPYAAMALVGPAAVALDEGWLRLRHRLGRPRLALAGLALATALAVVPSIPEWATPPRRVDPDLVQLLGWLAGQPPRPDGREGVAALWEAGHAVQLYGRRPVLASPFGTEAGPRSLPDLAAFIYATREEDAEAVLARRRVGYVLLGDLPPLVLDVRGFAPPGAPEVVRLTTSVVEGATVEPLPGLLQLVSARLVAFDGAGSHGRIPPLGGFRLLQEAGPPQARLRLFGVVEGATLAVAGARPGAPVSAAVQVVLGRRRFLWEARAEADAQGRARLRVPYATGANGAAFTSTTLVADGQAAVEVVVGEEAVLRGLEVRAVLPPPARPR
jgi:asparagine N-glycosylation enzyme membrane subunit Stt3